MTTIVGRNVKVEVALTFAPAISPTAVTKANPPEATLAAHGLADGAAGYWAVTAGMIELDGQAILVDNGAANTFEMPGFTSQDYTTYTTGNLVMASTWGTLAEAGSYAVGGGAAAQLDDARLNDIKQRNVAGFLAPQDLTIDVKSQEIDGTAMQYVLGQAQRGLNCLFRISKGSQVLRVAYGAPSVPGENTAAGQLGTGQFNVICPAWVIKPNV